jgi:hypothetical protein
VGTSPRSDSPSGSRHERRQNWRRVVVSGAGPKAIVHLGAVRGKAAALLRYQMHDILRGGAPIYDDALPMAGGRYALKSRYKGGIGGLRSNGLATDHLGRSGPISSKLKLGASRRGDRLRCQAPDTAIQNSERTSAGLRCVATVSRLSPKLDRFHQRGLWSLPEPFRPRLLFVRQSTMSRPCALRLGGACASDARRARQQGDRSR